VAGALIDGVEHAGGEGRLFPDQVDVAFYGDRFRAAGVRGDDEPRRGTDITDSFEAELLYAWWATAAAAEPGRVVHPEVLGLRAPTPVTAQRAINALLRSRCVSSAVAERFLLGSLRQVRWYLTIDHVRESVLEAVAARIRPDTRVVVAHSLGSVVAYEALCANPDWPVRSLVTVGSPLGMPKLIFDRLRPSPANGKGMWPAGVWIWRNLCDLHDVVAAVKELGPLFGSGSRTVDDEVVDNGWKVHDLGRHLTAKETGRAILAALEVRQ
jgi:pimeloyl-ACP methyl ester carboxylesterase